MHDPRTTANNMTPAQIADEAAAYAEIVAGQEASRDYWTPERCAEDDRAIEDMRSRMGGWIK